MIVSFGHRPPTRQTDRRTDGWTELVWQRERSDEAVLTNNTTIYFHLLSTARAKS